MYNTADSILFMTSARQAVNYLIGISESANEDYIAEMQHFIMNEATDYQVMSLVMTGQLPKERFNLEEENYLFDMFRDNILENFSDISEIYGMNIAKELVNEVGPLSPNGIDTAAPILKHLYESGAINVLAEKSVGGGVKGAAFDIQKKARGLKKSIPHKAKGLKKDVVAGAKALPGKAKTAGKKVTDVTKAGTTGAYQQMKKGAGLTKKGIGVQKKALGSKTALDKSVGKIGKTMTKKGIGQMAKGAGKMLGTAAAVTAAIYAGSKIYKNYLSKGARACAGQPNKAECMANYRKQAIRAQISAVQAGASKCSATKNPEKCKASIQNKVKSLQAKLAK